MKYDTKLDACRAWVKEFNAFPLNMLEKLVSVDPDRWWEITPISKYDRVYDMHNCSQGEVLEVFENEDGTMVAKVELDSGETVTTDLYDLEADRYGYFPAWGTMWSFNDSVDDGWLERKLQEMADCGFRIYESEEFGYFFGIDGAGYDFYESHWLPLYEARGLRWHKEV